MRETMVLAVVCLLFAVASVGAMVWVVIDAVQDRLPSEIFNMDSLLLLSICLLLAAIFFFCFAWLVRDASLWALLKERRLQVGNRKKNKTTP